MYLYTHHNVLVNILLQLFINYYYIQCYYYCYYIHIFYVLLFAYILYSKNNFFELKKLLLHLTNFFQEP